MKIEKLPSGSYRIRKTKKGKLYTLVLDEKPGKREAEDLMDEYIKSSQEVIDNKSFKTCGLEYIKLRENIISPSTKRSYNSFLTSTFSEDFMSRNIYEMTQLHVQAEINRLALKRKPKTVRNAHGFISAVFGLYRPDVVLNTTLPQKVKYEPYVPTDAEIKKLLDASKGTIYHIPFQLGVLGLRRSEVCALEKSDLKGNQLEINKAMIADDKHQFHVVQRNKTTEGKRTIYIPPALAKEIRKCEKICDMHPNNILKGLNRYQEELGIQKFRFHDLRHFYASYAHEHGMSDADIMSTGGWKSDYTMKSVYRHSMEKSKTEKQKQIANGLFS